MCFGCFGAHFGPGGSLKQPSTSEKSKMMLTKKMRTGKCWFEKGDFDHFGCVLGVLRLILDPGGSLKQPQHVISDPGVPKTAPARQKSQN